jgi:hypothetical protein
MRIIARFDGHCGASVIEFALVSFIFFLLLWGFFEFGRAFYVVNSTQHLTRCMARTAVVSKPSAHEAAKDACLMDGGNWPFFMLEPADLRNMFRLSYSMVMAPNTPPTSMLDTDIGSSTAYDDQLTGCTQHTYCVVDVTAYFEAQNNPSPMLGLLTAWIGADSTYTTHQAQTTMPAESMGWRLP